MEADLDAREVMTDAPGFGRMLRSVGAVAAGIVVGVVLSLGTDVVLHAAGVFPRLGQPVRSPPLVLATVYRTVYGVAAAYVTAWLAPDRPMGHALAGGVLGLIAAAVGAVMAWNRPDLGPHWYPIALVLLALPGAWAGGRLWLTRGAVRGRTAEGY
jgi:hypothetical protein